MLPAAHSHRDLWLPDLIGLGLLALLSTLPFWLTDLDLRLAALFYHAGAEAPWYLEHATPWRELYKYGPWLANATAIGGLLFAGIGYLQPRWRPYQRHAVFLVLVLIIGPGFIVHNVLKDNWGRPRPRQIEQFGGDRRFHPVLVMGKPSHGKAFPSGHSATGFYFAAFYFLFRRRTAALRLAALATGAVLGVLIGIARMAAGAHYATDVLWSAVVTLATAFIFYYFVLRIPACEDRAGELERRRQLRIDPPGSQRPASPA
jgi:lipid A 4'-phosphatase